MNFIQPKRQELTKTEWRISKRTKAIVRYYAEYTNYSEDEVVDRFLKNILADPGFDEWCKNKRRNSRIMQQIYGDEDGV
ncbi:hypothetical protein MO973_25360 [Paenibacillus sp. TRM 82003]|nr:hypothetical protein [Paenibacillus sp. TRM 82003]